MKKYTVDKFTDNIVIEDNFFIIFQRVPSEIEIIEPLFPGDDRERNVIKWSEKTYLKLKIPDKLRETINPFLHKLNYCDVSIEYDESKNNLKAINIVDFDELNNVC
jgi:hypothetical protein